MSLFGLRPEEPAAIRIREAATRGTLSHALLLTGSGDRMSAACFAAAALECTGGESRPCGVCPALHWKPPLRQRCWCCWQ